MLVRVGSQGSDVTRVQRELKAAGFNPGPIDGDFGPRTKAAVVAYQKKYHLAVDGVVGSQTWSKLQHDGYTPGNSGGPSVNPVTPPTGGSRADAVRAQAAQWAIRQANDPNIGYSQTKGRFGNVTDRNGHRYFDCSGLVFTAYKKLGVTLGGNWTGAMKSTWPRWADKVPKNMSQMKPGDLLLMNGHVVMYTGNGKVVGAQTSHAAFKDQVRAGIDAQHYLNRSDCIVLRPRV